MGSIRPRRVEIEPESSEKQENGEQQCKTPFPLRPMLALSTAVLAEGIAATSLFAYVGFMIASFGVSDRDGAGFYAGWLTAAFMGGRAISSFAWGVLADRYGRKPVLIAALVAIAGGSIGLGLSKSFGAALLVRFVTGFMNNIMAVCKTAISEVCGPEHEVQGMGCIMGAWSISFILGPSIGGLLSDLATTYPGRFSPDGLVARYPYLAPNIIAAAVALIGILAVHIMVPETMVRKDPASTSSYGRRRNGAKLKFARLPSTDDDAEEELETAVGGETAAADDEAAAAASVGLVSLQQQQQQLRVQGAAASEDAIEDSGAPEEARSDSDAGDAGSSSNVKLKLKLDEEPREKSFLTTLCFLLGEKHCMTIVATYVLLSFNDIAFNSVYPLWCLSTVKAGGLGWDPSSIGEILTLSGIFVAIFQFVFFSIVTRALGIERATRLCVVALVPLYVVFPSSGWLQERSEAGVWAAIVTLITVTKCLSNVIFSSLALMLNNSVSADLRGSVNGLAMTLGSIARGTGPPFGATVFAGSLAAGLPYPFDYHLAFYVSSTLCSCVGILVWRELPGAVAASNASKAREERGALAAIDPQEVEEDAAGSNSEVVQLLNGSGEESSSRNGKGRREIEMV